MQVDGVGSRLYESPPRRRTDLPGIGGSDQGHAAQIDRPSRVRHADAVDLDPAGDNLASRASVPDLCRASDDQVSTLWGDGAWANGSDWAGTGTISTTNDLSGNPDFIDPDAGDYHIGPDSDAIDQGVDAGVTSDIDHHPRPYQEPDIGADEYWPPGALKFIYLPVITR